ncbi:MAG: LuxR C-terminal-related transcriptional regulator [Roseiarcus sp.]|jgi:DNA-binding CsgD family transcriptional regulator
MDEDGAKESERAGRRKAARERRQERLRRDEDILDLLVSGYTQETIADKLRLSAKTVRRATARAIARRRLDGGAHYVHVQAMRLAKAMRVVDLNLENGDIRAVEPLLKVMAQLDRYHALAASAPPPRLIARTAPPLALAAPRAPAEEGTENGAQAVEIL